MTNALFSLDQINFTFKWLQSFSEQIYYLIPLCIHVALTISKIPEEIKQLLNMPVPFQMQQLHTFGWLLTPLITVALGNMTSLTVDKL
jgi:hypothetical protein